MTQRSKIPPLVRWFRDLREKIFGNFFEGPEPPERLSKIVVAFANTHPYATKLDWANFADAHARECYRAGWTRGFEYIERDPDEQTILHHADPNTLADALDPDWKWSPEIEFDQDMSVEVPENSPDERIPTK